MRVLAALERWAAVALLLACLALAGVADWQMRRARAARAELAALQAAVAAQNAQAAQTLQTLTQERDAAQARADAAHTLREQTDAQNQAEIARLAGELERRPVRVRVVTRPAACGPGGGGPTDHAPAGADAGAADASAAIGLLPARNAERLAAVIAEMETVNAAYASCRARLLQH
ncbi:hypothetical protein [Vandammella animalimorsus]|uniref:hypothetical protein n=1 Tax=Vandammella animalimorsus TaxID=2029117 RepID=UPI00117784AD|nr:hypothetical protein [Vandammella animalimorsus]